MILKNCNNKNYLARTVLFIDSVIFFNKLKSICLPKQNQNTIYQVNLV